ncbi:MAG: hypothetical protein JO142_13490 [Burkholderiales bacterium]|nr:hypothetical protein [Burkholderiales bacterium]
MNNAPKLSFSIRLATAVVALVVTIATVDSLDALSAHYVAQGIAAQMAASTQTGTQHA